MSKTNLAKNILFKMTVRKLIFLTARTKLLMSLLDLDPIRIQIMGILEILTS